MKRLICLLAALLLALACAAAETPFRYEHDPRENPAAMRDIVENPAAVYGFSPNPAEESTLKEYAELIDWTDPEQVAEGREQRRAYHESMRELYDMIRDLTKEGKNSEEIARAVSGRRNELRLEAYVDDPEGLETAKKRNLETYGNELGPTPESLYEKYGSWDMVIVKALGTNAGMDACLGFYDEYYYLYGLEEEEEKAPLADVILNLAIFLATPVLLFLFWVKVRKSEPEKFREAFRFFTVLSNILCSVSALAMAVALLAGTEPEWVWLLKYTGTAAVTVTMLTVFLFLAPSVGKDWYGVLLKRPSDLFMHLLTPVAALVSFCVFEKRGMAFGQSLWGMLPVLLYGPLYLYKIRFAPEGKRWPDFYGFDKNGKWPVMFAVMAVGTFLICLGLTALQNA